MGKSLNITLPKTAFVNRKEQKMKTKLKLAIVSAMLVGSAGLSTAGYAATDSESMRVETSVLMSCTVSAPTLTFPSYDPTAASDTTGTSVITSTCTNGGGAKITMGLGSAVASGSTDAAPIREMTGGDGTKLGYQLYKDSGPSPVVWGNTSETGKSFTAVSGANTDTVYGTITAGQLASVGAFFDFVLVTLTY